MAFKMDGPSLYKKPVGPRATLKPIDRNKFEQETGVMQGMENVEQELFSSKATHDIVKKNIKNKTNNMKKKSALKKMPKIIKGEGGYTYKYTSPEEAYNLRFPDAGPLKPAVYVYDKLEVKGPNSNTFTTVDRNTPEYKAIMKEIGGKIKYSDDPKQLIPNYKNIVSDKPFSKGPVTQMKRRSDGSMAKLKGQSFMKRMKMMNEASPMMFGPKRKTTKKKLPVDPLNVGGKITKVADAADKEMKNLIKNVRNIAKTDVPRAIAGDAKKLLNKVGKFVKTNKSRKTGGIFGK